MASNIGERRRGGRLPAFAADESGATAIEYSLVASIIALFIVTSAAAFGDKVKTMFVNVAAAF
jgi:pilus assembly protein Flp/PilA